MSSYYMTSSVSGQDEPNPALIGYPNGHDGAILPARDFSLGPVRSKIIYLVLYPI